jgi:three-Cys-motif partner protein
MTLADDDDEKWTYRKHTRAKHDILKYYTDVWTKIVSNENYPLRLFDCFAGRGDYVNSNGAESIELDEIESEAQYPGSPQILLDQTTKHSHLFDKAECYLFEPEKENRKRLKNNLSDLTGVADNVNPHIVDGEFTERIVDVVQNSDGFRGFGFFFLDPFGLKPIPFSKVSQITRVPQFDCLITLMTSELIRWRDSDKHDETFEALYGASDWKKELQSFESEDLFTVEAEYYCKRLESSGTEHTLAYMTTKGDSRQLKYHLVCTTNSGRGLKAMRESMMRCGTDYTLAYAPEHPDFSPQEQTTLTGGGMRTERDKTKAHLLTIFAGKETTFSDLVTQCSIDRRYEPSLEKDYREYLIQMDNDGEVDIPERESDDSPLPEDYVIKFPNIEEE